MRVFRFIDFAFLLPGGAAQHGARVGRDAQIDEVIVVPIDPLGANLSVLAALTMGGDTMIGIPVFCTILGFQE
ncbi:hypothetical protein D3C76_1678760 [compost metagenome]